MVIVIVIVISSHLPSSILFSSSLVSRLFFLQHALQSLMAMDWQWEQVFHLMAFLSMCSITVLPLFKM